MLLSVLSGPRQLQEMLATQYPPPQKKKVRQQENVREDKWKTWKGNKISSGKIISLAAGEAEYRSGGQGMNISFVPSRGSGAGESSDVPYMVQLLSGAGEASDASYMVYLLSGAGEASDAPYIQLLSGTKP